MSTRPGGYRPCSDPGQDLAGTPSQINQRQGDVYEGSRLSRSRSTRLGHSRRPDDHRSDRHRGPDRQLDDLWHRPAHPQGRCTRDHTRHRARSRGRRDRAGDRSERQHRGRRRPGAAVVRELVRALSLLQGGPVRPVPGWRRVDLRTLDRRAAGRVRARAVRGQLGLQGSGRAQRRAGPVPGRHSSDRLRGRRAQRHGLARRCRGDRRRRADRSGGDPHRDALHAREDRRD